MTTKKREVGIRNPEKYEYASLLYQQKLPQKEICERVGVTPATLIKWRNDNGWEHKRAARTISTDTLIAKVLKKINDLLDSDETFNADAFAKTVNQLKALNTKASIDDKIEVLTAFGDYALENIGQKGVTGDFIKTLIKMQNDYILKSLRGNE